MFLFNRLQTDNYTLCYGVRKHGGDNLPENQFSHYVKTGFISQVVTSVFSYSMLVRLVSALFFLFMCCKQKVFILLHVQQTLSQSNKLQNCKYCENLRHSLKLCHQGVPKQLLCFRLIGSEY